MPWRFSRRRFWWAPLEAGRRGLQSHCDHAALFDIQKWAVHYGLNFLIGLEPKLPPALVTLMLDLVPPLVRQIPIQGIRRQIVGSVTLASGQLLRMREKIVGRA